MSTTWMDLRTSLRSLGRSLGFTSVVVATLALGIGGCAAIFSFIDGVLLKPLPYPEPDRLVVVCETNPEVLQGFCAASPGNLNLWRRHSRSFVALGLARNWPFRLTGGGRSAGVNGGIAAGDLFAVFRAQPLLGRLLTPDDMIAGHEHVTVLSHGLWQSQFDGDPDIVGRTLELDDQSYTVVGVLPPDFAVPGLAQVPLWIPLWPERAEWRDWRGLRPFGRLADGVELAAARDEMAGLQARLAAEFPDSNRGWGIAVRSLHEHVVGAVEKALLVLAGAVGFVLLIACANVANLLLARATGREKQLGVRLALGATRGRLVRLLLSEALWLAGAGGALGFLLALWLTNLFVLLAPRGFPRLEQVTLDGRVALFTATVSLLTVMLFGLLPALQASRLGLAGALQDGVRSGGGAGAGGRGRRVLVMAEVALALVLLTGAGLLARSFLHLLRWEPGFERDHLVLMPVFNSPAKYREGAGVADLYGRAVEALRAVPGVAAASAASAGPLFGGDGGQDFAVEGRPLPPPGERDSALWYDVGPDYFRTVGIPLLRGRPFTDADDAEAPRVALVNETLARRAFPGQDPVGQRITMLLHEVTFEVVGVVRDVPPFHPGDPVPPEVYWPYRQLPRWAIFFVVRTAISPEAVVPALRAKLAEIDPEIEIGRVTTLAERARAQLVQPRFYLLLLGLFAVLALVIAGVGVYGILSYWVAQRTHEIGVRMALGARPGRVVAMIVGQGMGICLAGIALGVAGSLALTRFLVGLLVEVSPLDPMSFVAATAVLAAVALAACGIPARRAARFDPLRAVRSV